MYSDEIVEFTDSINKEEIDGLIAYMKTVLANKAFDIKTTNRLESHPCVITVQDMASARHFLRTQGQQLDDQMRYNLLQPRLEINANSKLIKKLCQLHKTDPKLADLVTQQVIIFLHFLLFTVGK